MNGPPSRRRRWFPAWSGGWRGGRPILAGLGLAGLLRAAEPADEAPVVLPPWVITEVTTRPLQTPRSDWFAAALGPTAVLKADAWSGRSVATLAEALRLAPGVMLQESFGGFEPPRISIRGSGLDSAPTSRGVALLVDGMPLARADGSFHAGLLDPRLFPRLEIFRGTMHMALTPAALGGVLHAASRPDPADGGTTVRVESGEFGARRAAVAYAAPGVWAAASRAEAKGWREHSAQERSALDAAWTRPLGRILSVEFTLYAAAADYEVPGPVTLADALARPRAATAAVWRDLPRRRSDVVRPALQLQHGAADGGLVLGIGGQRLRDDFYQLQANGETDAVSTDFTAHATWSRRVPAGAWEHRWLARATYSAGTNRVDRYLNDRAQRGARFAAYTAEAATAALSLEDLLWIRPTVAVGVGASVLRAGRDLVDRAPDTAVARQLRCNDVSPRLGLTWRATDAVSWQAAVSRGVEPPTFDDLVAVAGTYPNFSVRSRGLRAQRATTVEAGGRGRAGRWSWSLTAYHSAWSDEILRLADAGGLPRGAVNAGPTRHDGLEAELRWGTTVGAHRWSVGAVSNLGRYRFDGDPVYGDNRLAGAPPHTGGVEATYAHAHGAFAALETTWVAGRTPVDHAGLLGYGGQGVVNGRIGWRWDRRLTLLLNGRNLFDRVYPASTAGVLDRARTPATTTIFLPAAARSLTIGLEWKP
jgi:iron complex outermembrane receptor protein